MQKKISSDTASLLRYAFLPFMKEPKSGEDWVIDFTLETHQVQPTILRREVGPGSGTLILEQIPELADYCTVESLDSILEDFWWHPDIEEREMDVLGFVNPIVTAEDLVPASQICFLNSPSNSVTYDTPFSLATRLFLRHNPNALEIIDYITTKEGDLARKMSAEIHVNLQIGLDTATRWLPDIFFENLRGYSNPDPEQPADLYYGIQDKMYKPLSDWLDYFLSNRQIKNKRSRENSIRWIKEKQNRVSITKSSVADFFGSVNHAVTGDEIPFAELLASNLAMLRSLEAFLGVAPKTYAMDRLF